MDRILHINRGLVSKHKNMQHSTTHRLLGHPVPTAVTEYCFQDDLVIVDMDGGILIPQLTEIYVAGENVEHKAKNALALCEKLLLPKKLAVNLVSKFKEAIKDGDGPHSDMLLQKVGFL